MLRALLVTSFLAACGSGAPRAAGGGAGREPVGGPATSGGVGAGAPPQEHTGPACTAQAPGARLGEDFVTLDPPLRFARTGRLLPESAPTLDGLASVMEICPEARIEIRTAAPGNESTATVRADSVAAALAERGVDPARVRARGAPETGFFEGLPQEEASRLETEIVRVDRVGCGE